MGTIIAWGTLLVVAACLYFMLRNETKFKKNIVLGVTLPKEAHDDPDVQAVLKAFRNNLGWLCLVLTLMCAGGMLIPDLSIAMVGWSIGLLLVLLLPNLVYFRAHGKLRTLKEEKHWTLQAEKKIRVDVSTMISYEKPRLMGYVLPALICGLLAFLQRELWYIHGISALTAILSFLMARFCYRRKSETVDGNAERTKQLSRLRYQMWKRVMLLTAWQAVLISVSVCLLPGSGAACLTMLIVTSLLYGGVIVYLEMSTRKMQEKLTEESGTEWYVDEDDLWLGGMFYYNPNDSHVIVNNRVGTGTTFNMATKTGKAMIIGAVLTILGSALLCGFIGWEDRSPIRLELAEDSVICESGTTRYVIPKEEIGEVQLVETMPEGLFRTNALGGQHLYKGSFTGGGMLDLKIIADPTVPPYLKITTDSEQYYILGARDPAQTKALYELLTEE